MTSQDAEIHQTADQATADPRTDTSIPLAKVFNTLDAWVQKIDRASGGREQLPVQLWDLLGDTRTDHGAEDAYTEDGIRSRAIVDYIAGLTEAQTIDLHERMFGRSASSALSTWLTAG